MAMIDETFIVALAFVVFMLLAWRPIGNALFAVLDARSARIEKELSEAIRLREEAQVMLSDYEKRYREIEAESADIIEKAKRSANALREEAETELQKSVQARIQAAHEKIRRAETLAVQGVQREIVDMAVEAARRVIAEKMQDDADNALVKQALKDTDRIVH
ncbi:MAG: F0F1 ATP synthase subunit B [Sphaerospermopsis sp. SIO1G2]|nr:F0F1 ATP synthase subunit B [Sphaerospermopsis sp. SIO1G2]